MASFQFPKVRIRSPFRAVIGAAVDEMRREQRDRGDVVSRETPQPPQHITTPGTDENGRTYTRHIFMLNLDEVNDPGALIS